MTKTILASMLLLAACFPAAAASPPRERVICYTQWDLRHLYFAFKVDDTNLVGTNTDQSGQVSGDDAVEVFLDLGHRRQDQPGSGCVRISASVAGGVGVQVADREGHWQPGSAWQTGLKCDVKLMGTLNNPKGRDTGYVVEMAIPWKLLGSPPPDQAVAGFNAIVWDGSQGMTSWSSRVTSEQESDQPSRWGEILFLQSGQAGVARNDLVSCPLLSRPVGILIDGDLQASEWFNASRIIMDKPAEVTAADTGGTSAFRVPPLAMATYQYWYQADPGRPVPVEAHLLTDQPMDGTGPWLSYTRVQWHLDQLKEIQRAGIEVILPVYRGDLASRQTWARLGLSCLVQALKEARAAGKNLPLVAMFLDPSGLGQADLTQPAAQQELYGMIREFFSYVPADIRAQFRLGGMAPQANLVVLGEAGPVKQADPKLASWLRESFRRDFGKELLLIGDRSWQDRGLKSLDGYCVLDPGKGRGFDPASTLRMVNLTPGYDTSGAPLSPGPIQPRLGGATYRDQWVKALAARPELTLIGGWNDYDRASEIAPSRQYGYQYVDITRTYTVQMSSGKSLALALLGDDMPGTLLPGTDYQVDLLLKNRSMKDFRTKNDLTLGYRFQSLTNPKLIYQGTLEQGLAVMAGQTVSVPMPVVTRHRDGPLPAGDYRLSLQVIKSTVPMLTSHWFTRQVGEISLPVRVGQPPERAFTVLSTSTPALLEAGRRYQVQLTLRNDGRMTWKAKAISLGYHWLKSPAELGGENFQELEWEGLRSRLPNDVHPGQVVTLEAQLEASAKGAPLPAWAPDQLWNYQLVWDLADAKGNWFSRQGASRYSEGINVIAPAPAPYFADSTTPRQMQADRSYQAKVVLTNHGSQTWDPKSSSLGYHWYYWDGVPVPDGAGRSSLPSRVGPDQSVVVPSAQVKAPPLPGPYYLVWDLEVDGRPASSSLVSPSGSSLRVPVAVSGGSLVPLDLAKLANITASTDDRHRQDGQFTAALESFPAEHLVPDASAASPAWYPCGYQDPKGCHQAVFQFLPAGKPNAVSCQGQAVQLAGKPLKRLHLLGAASEASADVEFTVVYADGSKRTKLLTVSSWLEENPQGAHSAFAAPHLHSALGDEPARRGFLHHYRLELDPARAAVRLDLPNQPSIKLMAITEELP